MTKQTINVGTSANDRSGDSLRTAFQKINSNFTELYTALGLDQAPINLGAFEFSESVNDVATITTTDSSLIVIDQATTVTSDLTVGGDILPQTANGGDLGSAAKPWRSLYVSNSTIYLGGTPLSVNGSGQLTVNGALVSSTNKLAVGAKEVVLTGGSNPFVTFPTVATGENITIQGGEIAALAGVAAITTSDSFVVNTNALTALKTWTFGTNGSITFPDATVQTTAWTGLPSYFNGDMSGSVFADDSTLLVDGVNGKIVGPIDTATITASALNLNISARNYVFVNSNEGGSIVLGQSASTGPVLVGKAGGIFTVESDTYLNGSLRVSGDIRSEGNINIDINLTDSTLRRWTFGEDGELTFPDGTSQSTAYTGGGITASSSDTFTNKTINIQTGQGNTFQIQGNSISSYSGSGAVVLLQSMPTLNAFNIGNGSNLTVDGGTGSYYWSGPTGVAQAGIDKAGVYRSSSSATNSLFTFAANGAGTMSAAVEGSLFIGTALPSNNGGLNTNYSGWLVVQSGGKFGGDLNTRGALIFDDAATGAVVFADGTRQTTAWDTGYLSFDDAALRGTSGYTYTFNTDGYFTSSTSSESTGYFFVTYNSTNLNIAAGWTVVGANCDTTVSSTVYPVAGYPGVIRINLTVAASSTSGFYPVVVTSSDRLKVQIQPNPGTASKYTFTTAGVTFPNNAQLSLGESAGGIFANQTTGKVSIADYMLGGSPAAPSKTLHIGGPDYVAQINGYAASNPPIWTFGNDRSLEIPGDIRSENAINIDINLSDSTLRRWTFGEDGVLNIPGSIQLSSGGIIKGNDSVQNGITIGEAENTTITFVGTTFFTKTARFYDGVHEAVYEMADATGVVEHDCTNGYIFYHTSPDANWTVNLTNFGLFTQEATTVTIVIVQGGTGYYPTALQIGGAAQTINWQGNTTPTPSTNRTDVVSFSIIRTGSGYTVLGQLTGF